MFESGIRRVVSENPIYWGYIFLIFFFFLIFHIGSLGISFQQGDWDHADRCILVLLWTVVWDRLHVILDAAQKGPNGMAFTFTNCTLISEASIDFLWVMYRSGAA